jgi:hypothetical protein
MVEDRLKEESHIHWRTIRLEEAFVGKVVGS